MCASCGCGKLEETHGDDRNITMTNLEEAAEAAGITAQEAAKNILQAADQGDSQVTGQTQAAVQGQTQPVGQANR